MGALIVTGASSAIALGYLGLLEERSVERIAFCQYHSHSEELAAFTERATHVQVVPFRCDLCDEASTIDWIDTIMASGVAVTDILHLAAMPLEYGRIKEYSWDSFSKMLKVQVDSMNKIAKTFFPQMAKQREGRVAVLLSSCTIGVPPNFMSTYVMCKYALLGFIKSAAVEYGKKDLRINGVSPEMIRTRFLRNLDDRIVEAAEKGAALGRLITVDEVVRAIDYLLSDASAPLNGVNMNLTGGATM